MGGTVSGVPCCTQSTAAMLCSRFQHRKRAGFLWVEEKDDFVLSPLELKTDLDLQKKKGRVTRTAKQTTRFQFQWIYSKMERPHQRSVKLHVSECVLKQS